MDLQPDWLEICPERFRNYLREAFDMPPGCRDSASVYASTFGDDFLYADAVADMCARHMSRMVASSKADGEEKSSSRGFTPEQIKFRHQYAQAWGKYAEAITARHILEKGLPIREINWSPSSNGKSGHGRGEIDIITQRGNRIIFVEVKARCGRHSDPLEAVDAKKRMMLCRGADIYLKLQREVYEYQFDIALLTGDYFDFQFEYIEDAFMAPLRSR
ncbi:MAG: YraN family protein [Muribaculaceae bacterium]|nr:YraN family protein [Muribaculaceae bacterium]